MRSNWAGGDKSSPSAPNFMKYETLSFNPEEIDYKPQKGTLEALEFFAFEEDNGKPIRWTPGQVEIIDCVIHRKAPDGKNRIQCLCMTRYGKSLSVAAGLLILASCQTHKIAIVAGKKEHAQIIMEKMIMLGLNCPYTRDLFEKGGNADRLRDKKASDRIFFAPTKSEIQTYSAESSRNELSGSLMGFGADTLIEDESAWIPDHIQGTVGRMLGDHAEDSFMIKIGNPFFRNHFYRTWTSERYYKIFIDCYRALLEGRITKEFIEEQREEDRTMFEINYECKFPPEGITSSDGYMALITTDMLEQAQERNLTSVGEPRLGIDVARSGRDFNVMVLRTDNMASVVKKWQAPNSTDTAIDSTIADEIIEVIKQYNIKPSNCFIDDTGVGGGVTDFLKYKGYTITPVTFGGASSNKDEFLNLRAELYAGKGGLKNWLEMGSALNPSPEWQDMLTIRYRKNPVGKLQIESKEDMRKRGLHSPDVTDALVLTFAGQFKGTSNYFVPQQVYENEGRFDY